MKKKFPISKNITKENILLIILILVSIIPLIDLLHPGLPITHDGQDHVARIANFYASLQEGNIIPRWAERLNWGYGHPILMFLYPLSSYTASLFHLLGFSLIDSVKLVFGLAFVFSGIAMYLWIREFLGKKAAFASALLYIFAPYRFVDLYVRGAIGEHVAFIFPPLILYFMHRLSKKYSYWSVFGGCLSFAALILSHNAISIMFLPFIIFYAVFLVIYGKEKIKLTYRYIGILVLGFGISSFFILPAFFEGKYTLRDIVTVGEYASRFVNIKDIFYGAWGYGITGQFTVQIGILQLILILLSIIFFAVKKNIDRKIKIFYYFVFICLIFSIFIMLKESSFIWEIFTTLQKFQFPWRFLSVTVFASSVIGGLLVKTFPEKIQLFLVLLVMFFALYFNKDYYRANGYLNKKDVFFERVYLGTTDTGESAPIWSVRFMEKKPKNQAEIIDGEGVINKLKRSSTVHEYEIISKTGNLRVKENTLYFPGWNVYVDGKKVPVEFQDPSNRGLITFNLGKGEYNILVKFEDTKLRQMSNLVSIASITGLVIYGIFCFIKRPRLNIKDRTKTQNYR